MLASIDEAVIRFGVNLPVQWKIRPSWHLHDRKHPFHIDKAIVRRLGRRYLPPCLVSKRKNGFPMYGHRNVRMRPGAFIGGYVGELLGLSRLGDERLVACGSPFHVAKLASVEIFGRLFDGHESIAAVDEWVRRSMFLDLED